MSCIASRGNQSSAPLLKHTLGLVQLVRVYKVVATAPLLCSLPWLYVVVQLIISFYYLVSEQYFLWDCPYIVSFPDCTLLAIIIGLIASVRHSDCAKPFILAVSSIISSPVYALYSGLYRLEQSFPSTLMPCIAIVRGVNTLSLLLYACENTQY